MSEFQPESARTVVDAVVNAVQGLVSEGINNHVVVRDRNDAVVLEVPVAVGLVAAFAAPVATTIAAGVALLGKWEIKVENHQQPAPTDEPEQA